MMMLTPAEASDDFDAIDIDSTERRRGLRICRDRPVKVLDVFAGRYVAGHTRDISATGLQVQLPASTGVRTGGIVHIHVGLNQTGEALANRRQMIPARVVWVSRSLAARQTINIGVEFVATIGAQLHAA